MRIRLRLSQYSGFLTIGFVASILGPMLSRIRNDIGMTYTGAGLILSGQFLGMILTVLIGGYLCDKYGKKPFLLIGGMFLVLGLGLSFTAKSFILLFIFTVISGIGFGTYEVGINALCSDSPTKNKGLEMNLLHFFYGVGAIIAPIAVTLCLKYLDSWRIVFALAAILPVIVSILLKPLKIASDTRDIEVKSRIFYKDIAIWISGIYIFAYVGVEVAMYGWTSTFWEKLPGHGSIPVSMIASIFWITLTIGRLICGKIADKAGFSRYITFASLGTLLTALVWTITSSAVVTLAAILLIGFFLAGIFPTVMASVISMYPSASGGATAFMSVFASLGGFLVPLVIGRVSDNAGIACLPAVVLVLSATLLCLSLTRSKLVSKPETGLSSVSHTE